MPLTRAGRKGPTGAETGVALVRLGATAAPAEKADLVEVPPANDAPANVSGAVPAANEEVLADPKAVDEVPAANVGSFGEMNRVNDANRCRLLRK